MSISFYIKGERLADDDFPLNMCNSNALDVMAWLGYPLEYIGELEPRELAARCRRKLWPEFADQDVEIQPRVEGRIMYGGRRAGYLTERTQELLDLAIRAGDRLIVFG